MERMFYLTSNKLLRLNWPLSHVKEHIIFPEVNFDRIDKIRGLDIVVVISAISKEHSFALLEKLNFPFIKKGDN